MRDDKVTRIKDLEAQVAALEARLERGKRKWPAPKPVRGKPSNCWARVIIADSHGSQYDETAFKTMLGDVQALDPAEVVLLGDHLECGGFLAQHHVLGYVAQAAYSFEDDVGAANAHLDSIATVAPRASIYYVEGNHEARIEKWCVTEALRHHRDSAFLMRHFGPRSVLNIKARGIDYLSQGEVRPGLHVPGTLKLGKCHFTHGHTAAKDAARSMLSAFGGNVVFGHVHRPQAVEERNVHSGAIGAWCPGCLCKLQPMWKHTAPSTWGHGYAVQVVKGDGTFLHINVPIIDGRSYLTRLAGLLKV